MPSRKRLNPVCYTWIENGSSMDIPAFFIILRYSNIYVKHSIFYYYKDDVEGSGLWIGDEDVLQFVVSSKGGRRVGKGRRV